MQSRQLDRRRFSQSALVAAAGLSGLTASPATSFSRAVAESNFRFNYLLASSLYGYLYLGEILPEVKATGATAIDLWPKVHGNQREQVDDLGEDTFRRMLDEHQVALGCITQYKLGPFGLADEMRFAQRFGCRTIVTGGPSKNTAAAGELSDPKFSGPKFSGPELKRAIAAFVDKLQPHLELAAELDVVIAIENHANSLIDTPDSMRWLVELSGERRWGEQLGIAFAPYHLPQDAEMLGTLIRDLGNRIQVFYAWEHGQGCMQRQPKEQELKQLPGRGGGLDFRPLVAALMAIDFQGWTEVFMHPFPRGIPILETVPEIRQAINASREYLSSMAELPR